MMRHFTAAAAGAALCAAFGQKCYAGEGDVIGPTYPVAEEHLLHQIERKLRAMERSGELAARQRRAAANARRSVERPESLGLPVTTSTRTRYFDPSYNLPSNVLDASGNVVFVAGTRANPLDVVSMSRPLLFFDASDPRQVAFAARWIKTTRANVKPVLTGGSYLELMRRWGQRVYYDQRGLLVRKLGISHVPAVVQQEGRRLRIDEVEPK